MKGVESTRAGISNSSVQIGRVAGEMISRSATARPLLTPGEVMQLPPDDEIVMVAGIPPIRTKKARYFEDGRLMEGVLSAPVGGGPATIRWGWTTVGSDASGSETLLDDRAAGVEGLQSDDAEGSDDEANAGLRREPGLEAHKEIVPEPETSSVNEFDLDGDDPERDAVSTNTLARRMRQIARQASMDPNDGVEL